MGSKKKKKDATYQVAVSGAKGTIRILLYVLLICVLIFVGKTAYSFGYLIFYQEPEAHTQADGQDVTVIVHEDDSVYDVGETLQEKGFPDVILFVIFFFHPFFFCIPCGIFYRWLPIFI